MTQQSEPKFSEPRFYEPRSSEPMFNVPPAVIATVAVLVLVHALRMLRFDRRRRSAVPADIRIHSGALRPELVARRLCFPAASAPISGRSSRTPFSMPICSISASIWLGCCRSAPRWRAASAPGATCAFMLAVAAAGAFAHLVSHPGAMVPMIGASAAISGAMAAAMRFVFQRGGPLGLWRRMRRR